MTTIAYNRGVIAYDGQANWGSMICDSQYKKLKFIKNLAVFCSGSTSDLPHILGAIEKDQVTVTRDTHGFEGIAVDIKGRLLQYGIDKKGRLWKEEISVASPFAVGSGGAYAMGAMHFGATAIEAVEVACKLDIYSGGEISRWTFDEIMKALEKQK